MADGDALSLNSIRRETEATRANLTGTVELAQYRSLIRRPKSAIACDAIKAEVSGHIKSRGEDFMNDITEAARRAPKSLIAGLPTDDGGQWTM